MAALQAKFEPLQVDQRTRDQSSQSAKHLFVVVGRDLPVAAMPGLAELIDADTQTDVVSLGGGPNGARHTGRLAAARARSRFARAGQFDDCFLTADAFAFDANSASKWHLRRIGEIRLLWSMITLLFAANRIWLHMRPSDLRTRSGLCLLALAGLRKLRAGALCQIKISDRPDRVPDRIKQKLFNALPQIYQRRAARRVTPARLELDVKNARAMGLISPKEAAELHMMATAVRQICEKQLLSVRLLRAMINAPQHGAWPSLWTKRADRVLPKHSVPITEYMLHLHRVLGLQLRFALNTAAGLRKFGIWYAAEAHRHIGAGWVPTDGALRGALLGRNPFRARAVQSLPPHTSADLAAVLEQALDLRAGQTLGEVFGPAIAAYLNACPLGHETGPSRIALCLALLARLPIEGAEQTTLVWQSAKISDFGDKALGLMTDASTNGMERQNTPLRPKNAVVRGWQHTQTGLCANMDMSCQALARIGVGFQAQEFNDLPSNAIGDQNPSGSRRIKRDFALHHVNGERIPQSVITPDLASKDRYHVGYMLWEFEKIPPEHCLALDLLDEIWTPSRFVQDIYAQATDKPVHYVGKGIEASLWQASDLPALELTAPDRFTFLVAFDFHSSVARKNPLAALRGFQDAFPKSTRDARLIIKTTPTNLTHWGDPEHQMNEIRHAAAYDERITVIEETYSRAQLFALIGHADCLISPHRAEGFGLLPAYAMALGTTVVATDYSGTRDFCSDKTAFPVQADFADAAPQHMIYPVQGAAWANIRHDDLVDNLRAVYDHPAVARRRALKGKRLMQEAYAPSVLATRYRERLSDIGVI